MPPKKTLHLPPPESQKVVESLFRTITSGVKELKSVLSHPHPHKSESDSDKEPPRRRLVGKQNPPENLVVKQVPVRRRYTKKQAPM